MATFQRLPPSLSPVFLSMLSGLIFRSLAPMTLLVLQTVSELVLLSVLCPFLTWHQPMRALAKSDDARCPKIYLEYFADALAFTVRGSAPGDGDFQFLCCTVVSRN